MEEKIFFIANICVFARWSDKVTTFLFLNQDSMDNITLFSIITIMSFFLLSPVAVFMEGVKVTPAYLQSAVSKSEGKIQ